jgi:hypothetical protein
MVTNFVGFQYTDRGLIICVAAVFRVFVQYNKKHQSIKISFCFWILEDHQFTVISEIVYF